jgi:hypothetical protein
MYLALPDQPVGTPANLGFETRSNQDTGELLMLTAWLGAVEFWLCLGRPAPIRDGQYRPSTIEFHDARMSRSMSLIFSWPDGMRHDVFKMERVGEQDGWATR